MGTRTSDSLIQDDELEIDPVRLALANRLFFRLYQCANMLHKTGSRAVEAEGLTTQQWAVLAALSRPEAAGGMSVNELARYLMVSRQNLSGVLRRMERNDHVATGPDPRDGRYRLVTLTANGRRVWSEESQPKIAAYYEQALQGMSTDDVTHALHYLLRILGNFTVLDAGGEQPS